MQKDSKPTVLQSTNSTDGLRCIDIFVRYDGTFGFAEYRRDFEDTAGWHLVGNHSETKFRTAELAWSNAQEQVAWLNSGKLCPD